MVPYKDQKWSDDVFDRRTGYLDTLCKEAKAWGRITKKIEKNIQKQDDIPIKKYLFVQYVHKM